MLHSFLTTAGGGGGQIISRPDRFASGEKIRTYLIGSLEGHRTGQDGWPEERTTCVGGNSKSVSSSQYAV